MIIKSYEIQKNPSNFLKYKLFLLYGENNGLKKDIRESIKKIVSQQDTNIELLPLYENDIISNEENFYNSIYSGSLFSDKKIITINNGTDKIIKQVEDIANKPQENVFIIIFAHILEKKSKLRNFFEKNPKTLCVPCYLDNSKDLQIITLNELKKKLINNTFIFDFYLENLISKTGDEELNKLFVDSKFTTTISSDLDQIEKEIVTFVVINNQFETFETTLLEKCKALLPHYMIPSKLYKIDKFPYGKTGKHDLNALKDLALELSAQH